MTINRRRTAVLALPFAACLAASAAEAQSPPRPALPPGAGMSIGQDIDRALSQVPRNMRPGTTAQTRNGTIGQEIDQLLNAPMTATPGTGRQVTVGFTNKLPIRGYVIQFTPTNQTEWGANRLHRERLNPGATMRWRVNDGSCRFDVRITFEDDNEFVRLDHDFCAQNTIEITAITPQTERPPVRDEVALYRVVNRSGEMVATLRVTPVGARTRGPDLLGEWVMANNDQYTGRVARRGGCVYDIRAAFTVDERETTTIARQNLCEAPEIVIPPRAAPQG